MPTAINISTEVRVRFDICDNLSKKFISKSNPNEFNNQLSYFVISNDNLWPELQRRLATDLSKIVQLLEYEFLNKPRKRLV